MVQLHQPCLTRLLAKMAMEQQLLEASMLDLNGNRLLFITAVNTAAQAGYVTTPLFSSIQLKSSLMHLSQEDCDRQQRHRAKVAHLILTS
jgi:hypothetical protein